MDAEWTDEGLAGTRPGQLETCVHFFASDLEEKGILQKPKPFIRELHTHLSRSQPGPGIKEAGGGLGKVVSATASSQGNSADQQHV